MPTNIAWIVEHQLALISVWDDVTSEDLLIYDQSVIAFLDSSSRPLVHGVFDFSCAKSLPSLMELTQLKSGKDPKSGWIIFVGLKNLMLKFLATTTSQIFKQRIRSFDTFEEALVFLQDVDSTLPLLSLTEVERLARKLRISEFNSTTPPEGSVRKSVEIEKDVKPR